MIIYKKINMEEILNKYNYLCSVPSDINEHLPVIKKYAEECDHITEMGVRYVVSTWASLAAKPKSIICYDILTGLDMNIFNENLNEIKNKATDIGVNFSFIHADVLNIKIEETDLLMIDTYHEYNQIKKELSLHGNKAKKFLIFHDTTTFGEFGETFKEQNTIGIWPAIEEFINENPHWVIQERLTNNNGLTILKRKP
jgi:hypothetical protein